MYDQLLADAPDDGDVCRLKRVAHTWRERLLACEETGIQGLQALQHNLSELTSTPLQSAILDFMIISIYDYTLF